MWCMITFFVGGDFLKKQTIGLALFTGAFVGLIVFLMEYFFSNVNLPIKVIIAAISALVGGWIAIKLFFK